MSLPPLPRNFGSAVDLSGLGKPAVLPENLPGIELTQQSLVEVLIPASHAKVVIVLCWSPRSDQYKSLMEMMGAFHSKDLTADGKHTWEFAHLNVDAHPQIAQALQVQSVPVVIAIIQEQVVPLFESVPPVEQVRLVLDKVLEIARERGVGEGSLTSEIPEEVMEPEEVEAMAAMEAHDLEGARTAFKKWIARKPGEAMAKVGLAQTELMIRIQGIDPIDAIKAANDNLSDIDLAKCAADMEISAGLNQAAFARLIELIKQTSGDDRKNVRDHLLQLFELVDPSDPDLIKARGALASALF